jgi:hypothetical protein
LGGVRFWNSVGAVIQCIYSDQYHRVFFSMVTPT